MNKTNTFVLIATFLFAFLFFCNFIHQFNVFKDIPHVLTPFEHTP